MSRKPTRNRRRRSIRKLRRHNASAFHVVVDLDSFQRARRTFVAYDVVRNAVDLMLDMLRERLS